jgi:hypothetical protein
MLFGLMLNALVTDANAGALPVVGMSLTLTSCEPDVARCDAQCRPPVLKITRSVLTGYENSLLYMILQPLTRNGLCRVLIDFDPL